MDQVFQNFINTYSQNIRLDAATIKEIENHLAIITLDKNHILLNENQYHDFAYFVVKGAVRSYYLKDGVEVNTWFAFENEMVGSLHNYKNLPSRETFQLVENAELIAIKLRTLKPLVYTHIQVSNFITAIIEEYALFLEDRIYFSQLTNSMERYLHLLEYEPHIFKRIPLTYIASYLGISRETLSRLRAK